MYLFIYMCSGRSSRLKLIEISCYGSNFFYCHLLYSVIQMFLKNLEIFNNCKIFFDAQLL